MPVAVHPLRHLCMRLAYVQSTSSGILELSKPAGKYDESGRGLSATRLWKVIVCSRWRCPKNLSLEIRHSRVATYLGPCPRDPGLRPGLMHLFRWFMPIGHTAVCLPTTSATGSRGRGGTRPHGWGSGLPQGSAAAPRRYSLDRRQQDPLWGRMGGRHTHFPIIRQIVRTTDLI